MERCRRIRRRGRANPTNPPSAPILPAAVAASTSTKRTAGDYFGVRRQNDDRRYRCESHAGDRNRQGSSAAGPFHAAGEQRGACGDKLAEDNAFYLELDKLFESIGDFRGLRRA